MTTGPADRRTARNRTRATVACGALLGTLTGCSVLGSDPVEEQWESRAHLTSCGSLRLDQMQTLEVDGRDEVSCLERALESGTGAELTIRYPTVEGDPVTEYYRVTPSGSTEVYTDATQDAFDDGASHFASCDDPGSAQEVTC